MNYDDILEALESRPKYRAEEQRRRRKAIVEGDDRRWFAIRVAPQREFTVEAMLRTQGFEVFLPTEVKFRKTIKKGRRVSIPVSYAMFVRYLFVRKPFSWLHLMAERHITGVVGFEGVPAPIEDAEIERLRGESGGAVPHRHSVNPHRALRTGELAEICEGVFTGQIVKIEGLHGRKAKVFLNLFGGQKLVEIDIAALDAA